MAKTDQLTPLMKQYFEIREQYQDAVLLFQVGDFYELFFEDAKKVSAFLAIALTKRGKCKGKDVPLCGVPIHALNHYLVKLIKGGFKVAICDQVSKPQPGTIVQRAVTRVFTPGTLTDEQMLDDKSASYLLSFYPGKEQWGLIFTEILTAQIFATIVPADSFRMVETELTRFFPDEVIIPSLSKFKSQETFFRKLGYSISVPDSKFVQDAKPAEWVESQFSSFLLQQLEKLPQIKQSLYLLYYYLKKNQAPVLDQFKSIQFYQPDDYLILDSSTQKNLELIKNTQDGLSKNTLFSILDKAVTPMGSRMVKKWIQRPLIQKKAIIQRQEIVHSLCKNISALQQLEEQLANISDLERIVGRIALNRAQIYDYRALKNSLIYIPSIKLVLQESVSGDLSNVIQDKLKYFSELVGLLEASINCDISFDLIIKKGFDAELDRLRSLVEGAQKAILRLEQQEIEKTKITSLKIRFNNISGYYIEITKPNLSKVPEEYIHQQTLVNRTRFVTKELQDLERDILRARNEIEVVEALVFNRVKKEIIEYLPDLRQLAHALAYTDGLLSFARVAYDNNYKAPLFNENNEISITNGRHPVVEQKLQSAFVPNNALLNDKVSLWVLTGPNMGGKSTYLRQVALICIMAQCGSLISADKANLPILDRIFTRIGSGDNLAEGKSTFLVEMEETAVICNQATNNSLVILDEVGRGTSTFDGMALAQAIIEHIVKNIGARCLFATHYHELTHLKDHFDKIANYHVSCRRTLSGIAFLYKILQGAAEGSFGLDVAKLAQLPENVIVRAENILKTLEKNEKEKDSLIFSGGSLISKKSEIEYFQKENIKLKIELQRTTDIMNSFDVLNIDDLSPRTAFDLVWHIKSKQKSK